MYTRVQKEEGFQTIQFNPLKRLDYYCVCTQTDTHIQHYKITPALYFPPNWHSSQEIWGSGLHFTTPWWEGTACALFILSGLSGVPGAEQTGPSVSVKTVCKQTAACGSSLICYYNIIVLVNRFVRMVCVNESDQNEMIHLFESLCTSPEQQQPMTRI